MFLILNLSIHDYPKDLNMVFRLDLLSLDVKGLRV